MSPFLVTSLPDSDYIPYLRQKLETLANEAITQRGVFILGVSGGSIISFLTQALTSSTDHSKWTTFLCDERLVPTNDPESTYGQYQAKLPALKIIQADTTLSPQQSAQDYEQKLKTLWPSNSPNYGKADCLLLGVGPDGHTCSLFPGHKVLNVKDRWVTFIENSPKPPPQRITITYDFINKADTVLVVGKGGEKWGILEKIQRGEDYPVGRVKNEGGKLEWILDEKK